MDYPAASWLSPEVEVRRSGIEGFGLFAVRGLAAGTVVERLGGRVIDDAELAALEPPYSSLTVAEGVHLLLDPAHPVRYGNHSCAPNLWHVDATTIALRTDVAVADHRLRDPHRRAGVVDGLLVRRRRVSGRGHRAGLASCRAVGRLR
jgi:hypothetical protein